MPNPIAEAELNRRLADRESLGVFVHTPLCGTCKVAGRMLEIAATMVPEAPLVTLNLNEAQAFAQAWRIASVPALLLYRSGFLVEAHYSMKDVGHVLNVLKGYVRRLNGPPADSTGR